MGLLCALLSHKKLLKSRTDIELVVLCDEYINNYRDHITKYCDRLIVIHLNVLPQHHKLYKHEKYSQKWMDYIINKWHCLYFEEYAKILFIDIDILPANRMVYDIFTKYEEPYIFSCRTYASGCSEIIHYGNRTRKEFKDYYDYVANGKLYIDAGFALLTPNKTYHDEYFDFVQTLDTLSKKSVGNLLSQIDEVTIFYFLAYIKKITYNCFKESDTPVIPWKANYSCSNLQQVKDKINKTIVYNYLSTIKPFIKPIPLMWPEEYIWKILEREIISGDNFLKALSIRNSLFCYLYLVTKKEPSLEIIKKTNQQDIYNFIRTVSKEITLNDPIFSPQAYHAIQSANLLEYKDELNRLNGHNDIIKECCGLIKNTQYGALIK
ncbi:MAG: hypothetical protein Hyperionvirus2_80 [Hyperionvirus sp.]|uniref:Uncharacterized protein n=1 Tax=Hyperionvirus sp. TaxID=2487770 RepID=A0A3G5A6Q2_9VIRU|nr:MAG: hypothetical protein Hyperionvirus2_80 [Hyperionvirus sp.]